MAAGETVRTRPPRGERPPRSGGKDQTQTDAKKAPTDDKPKQRTPADRKLREAISNMYQGAGMVATGIGMRFADPGLVGVGVETVNVSDPIADAWLDLADQNPKVKAALKRITEVSAIGVLVGMHASIMLPLLLSRGVVPDMLATTLNPETLAAMQAAQAAAQAAAAAANGGGGN